MKNENERATEKRPEERVPESVRVRNKDIPLLADIFCIMQEVCAIEHRRDWQRDRMYKITQAINGMPSGGSVPHGLDEAFAKLAEIDEEHEKSCKEYVRQLRAAERILNGIPSRSMRAFVVMKYVMDVPDVQIRAELNISERGFKRARKSIEEAESMASVKWRERYVLADQ